MIHPEGKSNVLRSLRSNPGQKKVRKNNTLM